MSYLAQYMGNLEEDNAADLSAVEVLCRPYGIAFYSRVVGYLRGSNPVPPDEVFSGSELEVVRAFIRMSGTFLLDPVGLRLTGAREVAAVMARLKYRNIESQYIIALDGARRILAIREVSLGTASGTGVPVHTVWSFLSSVDASSFYIVHNHPQGIATPSDTDIQVAKYMDQAGRVVGFRLRDSVVVSRGEYASVFEKINQAESREQMAEAASK